MTQAGKILGYQLRDLTRNRWVIAYAATLFLLTEGLFRLGGDGPRVVLSLLNVVLVLVPLVSLMFGTMYLYNAREFIELLLAQPVGRRAMFAGLWGGLAFPLAAALGLGLGLPFLLHGRGASLSLTAGAVLLGTGVALTAVFTAIAFVVALRFDDRARGFGAALLVWLACAVLYDGLVLLVATALANYPLEAPLLALTLLNPLDLGRVVLLFVLDISALLGYTGAVFQRVLGTPLGIGLAVLALTAWMVIPLAWGSRRFSRRDF